MQARQGTQRNYHFAILFRRNRLLAIGQNQMTKPNNKMIKFAKRYNIQHWLEYPFIHAEIAALAKLWGRYHINSDLKLVSIRLNRFRKLQNSRPCKNCQKVLEYLGINKIAWSNEDQTYTEI